METVYREAVWNLMGTHRQVLENNWKMDQVSKYLEGEILVMPLPGDEKLLRALFPMEGLANALEMQQKLSAETFRAYRKDLSPLLEEGKISVKVIQKMARAYMEAWFKIHHEQPACHDAEGLRGCEVIHTVENRGCRTQERVWYPRCFLLPQQVFRFSSLFVKGPEAII